MKTASVSGFVTRTQNVLKLKLLCNLSDIMSIGSKQNIILLIISIIISGGTFYYIGRGPIAGLQEEIGQIGSENLVL